MPEVSYDLVTQLIGNGLAQLVTRLDPEVAQNLGNLKQREAEFMEVYQDIYLDDIQVFEGALQFLRAWPKKLAIVSNKHERFIRPLVMASPLREISWTAIVGGDTFEQKKPHPLPLNEVMKMAGVSPDETLMIGDGLPDVLAARAAGVRSISVGFGYAENQALRAAGAHAMIDHYGELAHQIEQLS